MRHFIRKSTRLSAVIALLLVPVSAPSFAQEAGETDAEKWVTDLAARIAQINADGSTADFVKKALLKATENRPKSTVRPTITKEGLDLEAFMSRYRLDQGTMEEALTDPANFYVFVSFSMDMKAIRQIGRSAGTVGGTLVLRGLVNNSLKETTAKMAELQEVVQGGGAGPGQQGTVSVNMIVDPTLYEKFRVSTVPTFVVTEASMNPCLDDSCADAPPPYDRLSGLVTVEYALAQIAENGFEAKKHAKQLLSKIRGK